MLLKLKAIILIPRNIYDWLNKHPVWSALISSVPPVWITFISIVDFIDSKGIFIKDGKFTSRTIIISFVLAMVYSIYYCVNERFAYFDRKQVAANKMISTTIMQSINSIVDYKISNYEMDIEKSKHIDSCYDIQIRKIVDELQIVISNILDISRDDIGISIIYGTKTSDSEANDKYKWQYYYTIKLRNRCKLNNLTQKNSKSAIHDIIYNDTDEVFYISKSKAKEEGHYYTKNKRNDTSLNGSIYCKNINYDKSQTHIAILCITTYKDEICNDSEETKRVFTEIIVEPYINRLKIELMAKDYSKEKCL